MATRNPELGIRFQWDVLNYRKEVLGGVENFVTDRSPLDNMVYFLSQNASHATQEETLRYIEACVRMYFQSTHWIHIRLTPDIKFEDDGMRVNNLHYQIAIEAIFQNCLSVYMAPHFIQLKKRLLNIDIWDMGMRQKLVSNYVSGIEIQSTFKPLIK